MNNRKVVFRWLKVMIVETKITQLPCDMGNNRASRRGRPSKAGLLLHGLIELSSVKMAGQFQYTRANE
jgi:hypothetical protein